MFEALKKRKSQITESAGIVFLPAIISLIALTLPSLGLVDEAKKEAGYSFSIALLIVIGAQLSYYSIATTSTFIIELTNRRTEKFKYMGSFLTSGAVILLISAYYIYKIPHEGPPSFYVALASCAIYVISLILHWFSVMSNYIDPKRIIAKEQIRGEDRLIQKFLNTKI